MRPRNTAGTLSGRLGARPESGREICSVPRLRSSIEETYTYRWLHTDEEVLDTSVEIIYLLLRDMMPAFDFLVENQLWPGFTFAESEKTVRLLDGISYARKGILLDTGHLLNTNYPHTGGGDCLLRSVLEQHGALTRMIRGIHLHQSVSRTYVKKHTGRLPDNLPEDYTERFIVNYTHIHQINRHKPWTNMRSSTLLNQMDPLYLTH